MKNQNVNSSSVIFQLISMSLCGC